MRWVLPLKKEEFDEIQKNGRFLAFVMEDKKGVVVLGRDKLSDEELAKKFQNYLKDGVNLYYIPIGEYKWEWLDEPEKNKIPAITFEDGEVFALLSVEAARRVGYDFKVQDK